MKKKPSCGAGSLLGIVGQFIGICHTRAYTTDNLAMQLNPYGTTNSTFN